MRTNLPPSHALPEGIIKWVAKYSGHCYCGKSIRQGQRCLFDKETRKLVCPTCGKAPAETIDEWRRPPEASKTMDRIKEIYVMRKPLPDAVANELHELLMRLRTDFATDPSARRLVAEVMGLRTDDDVLCIAMKYADNCHSCGTKQPVGTVSMWRKSSHRIWCLECYEVDHKR